jgi:hypothetical protein
MSKMKLKFILKVEVEVEVGVFSLFKIHTLPAESPAPPARVWGKSACPFFHAEKSWFA